jgi:hypothetical protein
VNEAETRAELIDPALRYADRAYDILIAAPARATPAPAVQCGLLAALALRPRTRCARPAPPQPPNRRR